MTRKFIRKTPSFRGIAPLIAVLTVIVGLGALAQARGARQTSGKDGLGTYATNPGPRLFVPAVGYDSGGYSTTSVVVGDLNDDGKLDLVVGNRCATSGCQSGLGSVGVLLGNGDGTFQAAVAYGSGGAPNVFSVEAVAIADLNGDHKPDILVTNANSSTVGVLLGNGDGTFQPAVVYSSGGMYPRSVAVADVNGDGKPDLLVANECNDPNCDGTVGVLLGNGNGTFQAVVTYNSGGSPESVAVADVNGDGKPDLVVASQCYTCSPIRGQVSVLLGNGDGAFKSAVSYKSGGYPCTSVVVADINGDGKLDLLAANAGDHTVGVLLGKGDGTFQTAVTYASGTTPNLAQFESVAVTDADGSETAGNNATSGGTVGLLVGNGDGTFQAAVNYPSGGYTLRGVAVGDVNGDGRPDLLLADECDSNDNGTCSSANEPVGSVGVLLNNVGAPPTTTSLVSSVNPADINWVVKYTATVANQSSGALNGTVLFQDGGGPIATVTLANNQAAYSTTYTVKGTHPITATYSGVLNIAAGSASAVLTETIIKPYPTTTKVTTSGSPSLIGQPVAFTATVTSTYGAIPDGELVTFYNGTTEMGTNLTKNEVATFTTSSLKAGSHFIKAIYAGDVNFKSSFGGMTQVVDKYPTTTTLTSSLNPSQFGQAVTFTAHVTSTGPAPTGTVKFLDGTTGIGQATLSGGVAKLTKSNLAVGTHPITAHYNGDAASSASTSAVVNQVVQ